MATLVDLATAKAHLRIFTPADDPGDAALQAQIDRAEAVILDYIGPHVDPPDPADGVLVAAVLLQLAELDRFRGDDTDGESQSVTAGDLSPVITNLLRRRRTPALA